MVTHVRVGDGKNNTEDGTKSLLFVNKTSKNIETLNIAVIVHHRRKFEAKKTKKNELEEHQEVGLSGRCSHSHQFSHRRSDYS